MGILFHSPCRKEYILGKISLTIIIYSVCTRTDMQIYRYSLYSVHKQTEIINHTANIYIQYMVPIMLYIVAITEACYPRYWRGNIPQPSGLYTDTSIDYQYTTPPGRDSIKCRTGDSIKHRCGELGGRYKTVSRSGRDSIKHSAIEVTMQYHAHGVQYSINHRAQRKVEVSITKRGKYQTESRKCETQRVEKSIKQRKVAVLNTESGKSIKQRKVGSILNTESGKSIKQRKVFNTESRKSIK